MLYILSGINISRPYNYIVTIIAQFIRLENNNNNINIDQIISQLLDESRRIGSKFTTNSNNYNNNYNYEKNTSQDIEMSLNTKKTTKSYSYRNKDYKLQNCCI